MPLKAWLWPGLVSGGAGLVLGAALWLSLGRALDAEAENVRFLKAEIAKLDRDIAEVRHIRDVIATLLARKQIVEVVQKDRAIAPRLFEELARRRPEGVVLAAVRDEGGSVFLGGFAASERQLSSFVASLGGSALFHKPQLVESHGGAGRFSLRVGVKGRQAPLRPGPPRLPADVHPGDPK